MGKTSALLIYGRTYGLMLAGLAVVVVLVYLGVPNA